MNKLTLEAADKIASGVVNCIKRNQFKGVTVHVTDHAGEIIVRKTMEDCSVKGIPEFSYAKAYTCIAMK